MSKDPLEGKTLKMILEELVQHFGWEGLGQEISINCFINDPSINSSLKFLRRTPWARAKVEALYLTACANCLDARSLRDTHIGSKKE